MAYSHDTAQMSHDMAKPTSDCAPSEDSEQSDQSFCCALDG